MRESYNVGIYGVGAYLPEEIRRNDWWPAEIVEKWRRILRYAMPAESPSADLTDGARRTLDAVARLRDDPFQGAVERRVMPGGMLPSEMETAAAKEALEMAGIGAGEVDFLLTYSSPADYLNTPNACVLHRNLRLPEKCFATAIEAACNSFLMQLTLADQMIRGGQAHYGILVQSCAAGSRLILREQPYSCWFGDGATAVVVGPVASGKGLLGQAHRADGSRHRALVLGVPGAKWYEEGRVVLYSEDPASNRSMLLEVADRGVQIVREALYNAGVVADDVDFYATHQATAWFRRVSQEGVGLTNAQSVDTFSWAGSLSASNIPLVLSVGLREGLLWDGAIVAAFSGGSGETWSSVVLRWGQ